MDLAWWLIILCVVLAMVRLIDGRRRAGRAAALSDIARATRMNYSPVDRFDLGRRLQRSAAWTAGLHVRDILYGTRGERRLFVATIERRATADDRPRSFLIACAEPLDHSDLKTLTSPVAMGPHGVSIEAYTDALAEVELTLSA
jgi:hypothetical protein